MDSFISTLDESLKLLTERAILMSTTIGIRVIDNTNIIDINVSNADLIWYVTAAYAESHGMTDAEYLQHGTANITDNLVAYLNEAVVARIVYFEMTYYTDTPDVVWFDELVVIIGDDAKLVADAFINNGGAGNENAWDALWTIYGDDVDIRRWVI